MRKYKYFALFRIFVLLVLPCTVVGDLFLIVTNNKEHITNYSLLMFFIAMLLMAILDIYFDHIFDKEIDLTDDANTQYLEQVKEFDDIKERKSNSNGRLKLKIKGVRKHLKKLDDQKDAELKRLEALTQQKKCIVDNIESLLNLSDNVLLVIDTQGKIVYANTVFYEYVGIKSVRNISELFMFQDDFYKVDSNIMFIKKLTNTEKNDPIVIPFMISHQVELQRIYSKYIGEGLFLLNCISINQEIASKSAGLTQNREIEYVDKINLSLTLSKDIDEILDSVLIAVRRLFKIQKIILVRKSNSYWEVINKGSKRYQLPESVPKQYDDSNKIQRIKGEHGEIIVSRIYKGAEEQLFLIFMSERKINHNDIAIIDLFVDRVSVVIHRSKSFDELKKQFLNTVVSLIDISEEVDGKKGHSRRVSHYSGKIAKEMGFVNEDIERIEFAAILHNIERITTASEINCLDVLNLKQKNQKEVNSRDILKIFNFDSRIKNAIYNCQIPYSERHNEGDILNFEDIISVADFLDKFVTEEGVEIAKKKIIDLKETVLSPNVVDTVMEIIENQSIIEEAQLIK